MSAAAFPAGLPRRPAWSARGVIVALLLGSAILSAVYLQPGIDSLVPSAPGLRAAQKFFVRALSPAVTYESEVPPGTAPLFVTALRAAWMTVVVASAAMSLAVVIGLLLAVLASSAWWMGDLAGAESWWLRIVRRSIVPAAYAAVRVVIALMRSTHELLWAVLLLAAFGLTQTSAVVAIAIPFGGTLAKVFSEMIDEAPRDAAIALRAAGASPLQVFFFGLFPRALPDMTAYAFYRFECSLRASAVLGFFGFPTLGYYIAASFENLQYGEVWTYLYTLFALVLVVDAWSAALRRRLVI
ncbi:MAG TPA: ABC transporter permease subunit [Thermoanaerobaculia bacterium]|nr:ABC transporter permease subunit [Thermoanaerobaculia bacterium]